MLRDWGANTEDVLFTYDAIAICSIHIHHNQLLTRHSSSLIDMHTSISIDIGAMHHLVLEVLKSCA